METQESLGGPPGNTRWVGNRRERPRWLYSVCKSDTCYISVPFVPSVASVPSRENVLRCTKSRVQNAAHKTQSAGRRPCIARKYVVSYKVAGAWQSTENDADTIANANKKADPVSITPEKALIGRRIARPTAQLRNDSLCLSVSQSLRGACRLDYISY